MNIPKQKKPSTGALKWIAGLLGRMDRSLAQAIPALAAAMAPPMPKCIPFHKRPGYIKRLPMSAKARRHVLAAERRAAAQQPKFPKARVHHPHPHPLRDDVGAFTLVGSRGGQVHDHLCGRRMWVAGISSMKAQS